MSPVHPKPVNCYRSTLAAELARRRALGALKVLAVVALVGALIVVSVELHKARRELRRLRAGVAQESAR